MSEFMSWPGVANLTFETADDFLNGLRPRREPWSDNPKQWIYRGQRDAGWQLQPNADRDINCFLPFGIRTIEPSGPTASWVRRKARMHALLTRFRDELNASGLPIPTEMPRIGFEEESWTTSSAEPHPRLYPLMALAQHHLLPTHLLDWSRRALTAAYFAARDASERSADPNDSATRLAVWGLRRGVVQQRQRHASFEDKIRFYEAPASTNPNLHAQQGLFTALFTEGGFTLNEHLAQQAALFEGEAVLVRMTLPITEAPKLLRYLAEEGVTGASLFPGTDGVVRAMRDSAFWDEPPTRT